MRHLVIGAVLLCLTGCGKSLSHPVPVVLRPEFPAHLCAPVEEPVFTGKTNADLVEHVMDLRMALQYCNADKAAMLYIIKKGESE